MSILSLLHELKQRDIHCALQDDEVVLLGPKGTITDEVMCSVRKNKAGIVSFLRENRLQGKQTSSPCAVGTESQTRANTYMHLLNNVKTGTQRCIFCFPCITAYGVIYRQIACRYDDIRFYAFDHINEADLVGKYVDAIVATGEENNYTLLSHSSGGLIAFQVAQRMESMGLIVSGIVLFDCPAQTKEVSYKLLRESEQEIDENQPLTDLLSHELFIDWRGNFVDHLMENYLKTGETIPESVQGEIRSKLLSCVTYLYTHYTEGTVNADIHHIMLKKNLANKTFDWKPLTKGKVYTYKAVTDVHENMITSDIDKNMRVFKKVLNRIYR